MDGNESKKKKILRRRSSPFHHSRSQDNDSRVTTGFGNVEVTVDLGKHSFRGEVRTKV